MPGGFGFVTTRAHVVQDIFQLLQHHMLQYRHTVLTTQNILAMETSYSQNVWQLIGHLGWEFQYLKNVLKHQKDILRV
jgi:hypothetical protein